MFENEQTIYTSITTSVKSVLMDILDKEFINHFESGDKNKYQFLMDTSFIAQDLFIFSNYSGPAHQILCTLPPQQWGRNLGRKVNKNTSATKSKRRIHGRK